MNEKEDLLHLELESRAGMAFLEKLEFHGNYISDLSPLAGLVRLQEIWACRNKIKDLAPLAKLERLKVLDLEENYITDLSTLPAITSGASVDFVFNQIRDIAPLVEKTANAKDVMIGLGDNPLNEEAFSIHIPAMHAQGNHVFERVSSTIATSKPFPEERFAATPQPAPTAPEQTQVTMATPAEVQASAEVPEIVVASNATERAIPAAPPESTEATAIPRTSPGPAADIAVQLADTQFNVSVESSGFDLASLLGAIAFLGALVMLVVAFKLPRASRR